MTAAFVRGFKARAERLALELRGELKLLPTAKLDPEILATHLGIEVITLADLSEWGSSQESIDHFLGIASSELSAITVTLGSIKLIVVNPRHATTRRSSSLAHELSPLLLEHEPGPVRGTGGCRRWDQQAEDEADWLAGVLLVPREAALQVLLDGLVPHEAARRMGVSPALMRWRMNASGATAQYSRAQALKTTRSR